MADFRNLIVWKKSRMLAVQIYALSETFPQREIFGLSDQMRRAAVSISSNIAEGYGRQSDLEFMHFLHIARGSLFELRSQLYIAEDLGYVSEQQNEPIQALCEEISKMIAKLVTLLRAQGRK